MESVSPARHGNYSAVMVFKTIWNGKENLHILQRSKLIHGNAHSTKSLVDPIVI